MDLKHNVIESKMKALLVFTIFCLSSSSAQDLKTITADSGQTVTLPCRAPNDKILRGVEWSRPDLKEQYVLLYRDGQFLPDDQHPSFKDRADLEDTQMEGQDVSLILKNVSTADEGRYECQVLTPERKRGKRAVETISIINLRVAPPGPTGGTAGLIVGLSVFAVLLVAAVGFVIYRKHTRNQSVDSFQPSSIELQPLESV